MDTLPNDVLELIFNYINENDIINLSMVNSKFNDIISCFLNNINYYTEDKIYKFFEDANPLVIFIPKYRKDINYGKAITYLYFEKCIDNNVNYRRKLLTLKLRNLYPNLSKIINYILNIDFVEYEEIDYVEKFDEINYILKFDDVDLLKKYINLEYRENVEDLYDKLVCSHSINILKYIISINKDDFKNHMIKILKNIESSTFNNQLDNIVLHKVINANIMLCLLEHFNIDDLNGYIDIYKTLEYFINICDDNIVLALLSKINSKNINLKRFDFLFSILFNDIYKYLYLPKSFEYIINNIEISESTFNFLLENLEDMRYDVKIDKKIVINMLNMLVQTYPDY